MDSVMCSAGKLVPGSSPCLWRAAFPSVGSVKRIGMSALADLFRAVWLLMQRWNVGAGSREMGTLCSTLLLLV